MDVLFRNISKVDTINLRRHINIVVDMAVAGGEMAFVDLQVELRVLGLDLLAFFKGHE